MKRRTFLQSTAAMTLVTALRGAAATGRAPRILLRSSWQVVNIGDIAHTPGVLALIATHLPEAEVRLWASGDLSPEVAAMEQRRFPGLKIVKGTMRPDGKASTPELDEAVAWTDFLLHGSGPSLVAADDVAAFSKQTGKPYGVYGITHGSFFTGRRDKEILSGAAFVYFRDSVSLARAKAEGVTCPVMEFGPDGAFACDLRDDAKACAFMARNGLAEGQFVCCIPRLRYTPYWRIKPNRPFDERAQQRHRRNEAMAEQDIAPLREAIAAVVRQTDLKVLVCPEDMTQMQVGKRWIMEKLPADVGRRVVWRERFWLTDEALSTYVRSTGLFGLEMHSPIMCVGNGIPAIVCRFEEQTSKGFMWRDIGLGDWLFDFDTEEDRKKLTPAVLEMIQKPAAAKSRAAQARAFVEQRQRETMAELKTRLAG